MTTPSFADGSDLPDYTPGGSLHRPEEGRERIHVLTTTDAELVADLWGVLVDFEVNTAAIQMRFEAFIRSNYGDEFAEKLHARSRARFDGDEAGQADDTIAYLHPQNHRYKYGHTEMVGENWTDLNWAPSAFALYE